MGGFPFDELKGCRNKEPERSSGRRGVKTVDSSIFYCPDCRQCWEYLPYISGRTRDNKVVHYDDFPSINKPRKVCYECKTEDRVSSKDK